MSILEGSRYGVLNEAILLRYIRWRRLATNSETNTEVHEHTVRVLARATPMPAIKRLATGMMAALLTWVQSLEMRGIVDDHYDVS